MKKLLTLALLASLPSFIHSMEPAKTRKVAASIPKFVITVTSPDGTKIAGVSSTGNISVWDARTKQAINSKITNKKNVLALAFVANGLKLRVTTSTGDEVYDIQPMQKMKGSMPIFSISTMSPDGTKIAGVSSTGNVSVWDARTNQPINSKIANKPNVVALAFVANGLKLRVATSTSDEVYDIQPMPKMKGSMPIFLVSTMSPDETKIAGVSSSGNISVWDAQSGQVINRSIVKDKTDVTDLAFDKQGSTLWVNTSTGWEVYIVQPDPVEVIPQIKRSPEAASVTSSSATARPGGIVLSPVGAGPALTTTTSQPRASLAVASQAAALPAVAYQAVASQAKPSHYVLTAKSMDGTKMAGISSTGTISVWDTQTGALINPSVAKGIKNAEKLEFGISQDNIIVRTPRGFEGYSIYGVAH